jgi:hypothetical protein
MLALAKGGSEGIGNPTGPAHREEIAFEQSIAWAFRT